MPVLNSPETLRVLNLARSEASELSRDWVGCEHVVLGLLHDEGGEAATELHAGGISLGEARAELARLVGRREEQITTVSPFSPRANRVLEVAEPDASASCGPGVA